MVKLKQVQDQAHKFYFQQWQGSEQPSPAFDGEVVYVTRRGWRHIVHDKNRTKSQAVSRLELLQTAKHILETKRTFDEYRQQGGIEFWSLRSQVGDKIVCVVVRSAGNSPKHFFSVFVETYQPKK